MTGAGLWFVAFLCGLSLDRGTGWAFPFLLAIGGLAGIGFAFLCERGRAIVFDEVSVWSESPKGSTPKLLWSDLQYRRGRVPALVSSLGRTVSLQPLVSDQGLDAEYLRALARELPKTEVSHRVSTRVLAAIVGVSASALVLAPFALHRQHVDDTGIPVLDLSGVIAIATGCVSVLAIMIVGFAWLSRIGEDEATTRSAGDKVDAPVEPSPRDSLGEIFRTHRYRPPAVTLVNGATYRYAESEYWQAVAKEYRESGFGFSGLSIAAMIGFAVFLALQPGRPVFAHPRDLFAFGGLSALFCLPPILFFVIPTRDDFSIRVEGDAAHVRRGSRERKYDWPPARTRRPTVLLDWTDELRSGRRSLRIDRRLLVPEDQTPHAE